jgi:hypothetical protein
MKTPILPLALAPLALALVPLADEVRYHPKEGLTLTREVRRSYELKLEEISVEVNGQPMEVEGEMEIRDSLHIVVDDEIVKVGDGRPAKLVRDYETLSGETTESSEGEDTTRERSSALEGKKVAFTWDSDEERYDVAFAGGEGDGSLLEGLQEDMDLRAFLPSGEVDDGDSWDVDAAAMATLLRPGGEVKLKISEGQDPANEMGAEFAENLSGDVTATYRGTREVDGVQLAVIEIEAKVETRGGDEESQGVALAFELKGEMLWHQGEGRLHSVELRGPMRVTVTQSRSQSQGDQEFTIEQRMQLAGEASFELEVRR